MNSSTGIATNVNFWLTSIVVTRATLNSHDFLCKDKRVVNDVHVYLSQGTELPEQYATIR